MITRGFLDDRNAVALQFANEEDSMKALHIICEQAPDHAFIFPDSQTIIMNKEDQELFAGLDYEEQGVATPEEVSNEDLARLRYEYLFGADNE